MELLFFVTYLFTCIWIVLIFLFCLSDNVAMICFLYWYEICSEIDFSKMCLYLGSFPFIFVSFKCAIQTVLLNMFSPLIRKFILKMVLQLCFCALEMRQLYLDISYYFSTGWPSENFDLQCGGGGSPSWKVIYLQ